VRRPRVYVWRIPFDCWAVVIAGDEALYDRHDPTSAEFRVRVAEFRTKHQANAKAKMLRAALKFYFIPNEGV
jgi:hypothetical protein